MVLEEILQKLASNEDVNNEIDEMMDELMDKMMLDFVMKSELADVLFSLYALMNAKGDKEAFTGFEFEDVKFTIHCEKK